MTDQPRYEPFEESKFFADGQASRPLVAGTVPRGIQVRSNGSASTHNWIHHNVVHGLYSAAPGEGGDGIMVGDTLPGQGSAAGLVNVLALPGGPSVAELAEAGVRRISVGGAFAFAAYGALIEAARELADEGTYGFWDRAKLAREVILPNFG